MHSSCLSYRGCFSLQGPLAGEGSPSPSICNPVQSELRRVGSPHQWSSRAAAPPDGRPGPCALQAISPPSPLPSDCCGSALCHPHHYCSRGTDFTVPAWEDFYASGMLPVASISYILSPYLTPQPLPEAPPLPYLSKFRSLQQNTTGWSL